MQLATRVRTSVLAFSTDSDHCIFQSWQICQKQLAVTRLMCDANVRLVSISKPRHFTLHFWDYLMTLQYDYCSVCLGHLLAWACPDKLCFICISLFDVIQLSSSWFWCHRALCYFAVDVELGIVRIWVYTGVLTFSDTGNFSTVEQEQYWAQDTALRHATWDCRVDGFLIGGADRLHATCNKQGSYSQGKSGNFEGVRESQGKQRGSGKSQGILKYCSLDQLFMLYFHNFCRLLGALPPDPHWGSAPVNTAD